jgi:hypothetical protein
LGLLARAWNAVPAGQVETKSAIERERAFIRMDSGVFAAQVAKDIRGLEKQVCLSSDRRRSTSLFVFTNKLARDGKFLFCTAAVEGRPLEVGVYPTVLVKSAVLSSKMSDASISALSDSPLMFSGGLRAAKDLVQSTLARSGATIAGSSLAVIVKTHHGEEFPVTSRHALELDLDQSFDEASYIQSIISRRGRLSFAPAGISVDEFAKEITSMASSPEVIFFDHAGTTMPSPVQEALGVAFGVGKRVVFIPPPAGGGYESVSWGNLPPAQALPDVIRTLVKPLSVGD